MEFELIVRTELQTAAKLWKAGKMAPRIAKH